MRKKNIIDEVHYFYKITNNLNGNYYYGVHSTTNLNDGYFGSGYALLRAIKKYGKANFTKENLKFFNSRSELLEYEKQIVTKELINDPKCYNISLGGIGESKTDEVTVRDKDGNYLKVNRQDPRYRSGELVAVSKGRIHIFKEIENNVFINRYILKKELNYYLQNGWSIGTLNKGRIWVHLKNENGEIINRRIINNSQLDDFVLNSWELGSAMNSERINRRGKIYIHDANGKKKYIDKSDLENYLNSGWFLGSELSGKKHVYKLDNGNILKKIISTEELDKYLGNGWSVGYYNMKGNSSPTLGRIKVHKFHEDQSLETKLIHKDELKRYLDTGWKRGRISIKDRLLVIRTIHLSGSSKHHPLEKRYISNHQLENYLNLGWRIKHKKKEA